ncbi:hypothetical protein VQ03_23255 [Methylobacterium tarhaniae]|uniref:Uncharacterized protein n=1 Tax=Methylobacterium tarhaniae TaxID=1187852 RepID=A0A0J6V6K6_9HYPH|nr:hypothetical protein [Methylobacterium tarhaniae]KMO34536.1 hypothetical protein VQ03_23255 [Methylobacterium tarhaniae]
MGFDRPPVHPGEVLREDVLPGLGLLVSTAAKHLGVTRQALHRVTVGATLLSLARILLPSWLIIQLKSI